MDHHVWFQVRATHIAIEDQASVHVRVLLDDIRIRYILVAVH
jgi:hypothetical protein